MAAGWQYGPVVAAARRRRRRLSLQELPEGAAAYRRGEQDYRPSVADLTEDGLYTVIGGCCITGERCRHWRERHPEVTAEAERVMLPRAILSPQHEYADPKDAETVRRYARAEDGHWWRVVIKLGADPFVLTFHRVQKPGR
jgi:hypothetical protein